jgi:hypothetical protein
MQQTQSYIPTQVFNGQTFDIANPPPKKVDPNAKVEPEKELPPAVPVIAYLPGHVSQLGVTHMTPVEKTVTEMTSKTETVYHLEPRSAPLNTELATESPAAGQEARMAEDLSAREASFFLEKFNATKRILPFSTDWKNGDGHFYNLVNGKAYSDMLKPGETARSKDDQDRRMILIGTRLGPVVVYQRYPEGMTTLVYDASEAFRSNATVKEVIKSESRLGIDDLFAMLGGLVGSANEKDNIGRALEAMLGSK